MSHFKGIKSWPVQERPRERLFQQGTQALSDAELLAILLRNGPRGMDGVSWSREILSRSAGLRGLFSSPPNSLMQIPGFGPAKIATLLAAQEIIRRLLREQIMGKSLFQEPDAVMNYLSLSLGSKKREIFKILFLDKGHRLLDETDLFQGTLDCAAIYPREIIKAALECHAAALIMVHNHPSGRVQPSPEDQKITYEVKEACEKVGIDVIDHMIVGENQYFSFYEHNLMKPRAGK